MPSASGSPPLSSLGGTLLDGAFYLLWCGVSLMLFDGSVVSFVVRTMMAAKSSIVHHNIIPINLLLFLVVRAEELFPPP